VEKAKQKKKEKAAEFPRFAVVGARPVKIVKTADGGLDVLAWDWEEKALVRNFDYLAKVMLPEGETEIVSEKQFENYLEKLRKKKGA
jgi:hypothetical protein